MDKDIGQMDTVERLVVIFVIVLPSLVAAGFIVWALLHTSVCQ